MLFKRIKKPAGKVKIPLHKFFRIKRSIHTREIKDEIGFCAVFVKKRGVGVNIVFVDFADLHSRTGSVLTVTNIFKCSAKIFSDKTFGTGYEYLH